MVKRVLMIAYHYPPLKGSSGIQRTLKFTQYLPDFGWEPIVLTAWPGAYPMTSDEQVGDIPRHLVVRRAFALDTARHLSLRGRYPRLLALPDRWSSWCFGAIPAGMRLIRALRPDLLWSTYPIASAHLIAYALHRMSGIPWIADFRDPMVQESYPSDPRIRQSFQWIEKKAIDSCAASVFTTPETMRSYRRTYAGVLPSRFHLIENGYDEENFIAAEAAGTPRPGGGEPVTLVHSGVIYPSERDPIPLFQALASLLQAGAIVPGAFRLVLRATGHDDYLRPLIGAHGISAIVELAPPLPYNEALSEMLHADALLVLQAANCNDQIPAKVYEYIRARRPILALTDPQGSTAAVLRDTGIHTIARLDAREDIMRALPAFLALVREKRAPVGSAEKILASSRRARTRELATLLDETAAHADRKGSCRRPMSGNFL